MTTTTVGLNLLYAVSVIDMPALDFKEIPKANVAGGEQDTFELFARDFLQSRGYTIVSGPDRGADKGRDLIALEVRTGIGGRTEVRWLVSCKHKAHSGESVTLKDEQAITDRIRSHDCQGFIGFYSTLPQSFLAQRLEDLRIKGSIEFQLFDRERIERDLLNTHPSEGLEIAMRYFPESFKKWHALSQMRETMLQVDAPQPFSNESFELPNIQTNTASTTYKLSTPGVRKFDLRTVIESSGQTSRMLMEGDTIIWDFLPLSAESKSLQTLHAHGILVVSDSGACNIPILDAEERTVKAVVELDSYEAGELATPTERKKFGTAPVVRRHSPSRMAVAGSKLFVCQSFSEFLLVVDLKSATIVKRLPVGSEGDLAVSPDERKVYFASNQLNAFFEIDAESYSITAVGYPEAQLFNGCVHCCSDSGLLYLGLHRTSGYDEGSRDGSNSFLAIYDPAKKVYVGRIELSVTDDEVERSWPRGVIYAPDEKLLYVGMLGAQRSIYLIDTEKNEIAGDVQFAPNKINKREHADVLSLALYGDYLLSINRNNYELGIVDRKSKRQVAAVPLGGSGNGPWQVTVLGDKAVVSHAEYEGLIFVDLPRAIGVGQHRSVSN